MLHEPALPTVRMGTWAAAAGSHSQWMSGPHPGPQVSALMRPLAAPNCPVLVGAEEGTGAEGLGRFTLPNPEPCRVRLHAGHWVLRMGKRAPALGQLRNCRGQCV